MENNDIYLNVKPFNTVSSSEKTEPQLIHLESIVGCNVAIFASFKCSKKTDNTIKVDNIDFEMYPMFGIYQLGFKKIEVCKGYYDREGKKVRVLKIELGLFKTKSFYSVDCTKYGYDIEWLYDDIIDCKISYNLFGFIFNDRTKLKARIEEMGIFSSTHESEKLPEKIIIPRNGRPCQFKLVKEL